MILERKIALAMIAAAFVLPLLTLFINCNKVAVICMCVLALAFLWFGSQVFFGLPSDYVRKENQQ